MTEPASPPVTYPAQWEADVVLRDGSMAHVRPIRPEDADGIRRFHAGQSAESIYLRFFAPLRRLSDADVFRFTHVDYADRVALVATMRDEIIGILLGAFSLGDFLGVGVARRLTLLDRLDERAPLFLERDTAVQYGSERVEGAATAQAIAEQIELLAKYFEVVHRSGLRDARLERNEAAVGIDGPANLELPRQAIHFGDLNLRVHRGAGERKTANPGVVRLHEHDGVALRDEGRVGLVPVFGRGENRLECIANGLESHRVGRRGQRRRDRALRVDHDLPRRIEVEADVKRKTLVDGNQRARENVQPRRSSGGRAIQRVHRPGVADRWERSRYAGEIAAREAKGCQDGARKRDGASGARRRLSEVSSTSHVRGVNGEG